jgi:hypothetical protein
MPSCDIRYALVVLAAAASAATVAAEGLQARPARQQAGAPREQADTPRDPAGRANRPMSTVPTSDLVNMLDTYAIVQAQDALVLNDAQYGQFVTRLRRLQEMRRRNQRDRNQIIQALKKLTSPPAEPLDESAVRDQLKALREHDERAAADMRKAYDAVDEVLDARQQARFRIFEENMERRKLDLLVRARERAAARPLRR